MLRAIYPSMITNLAFKVANYAADVHVKIAHKNIEAPHACKQEIYNLEMRQNHVHVETVQI